MNAALRGLMGKVPPKFRVVLVAVLALGGWLFKQQNSGPEGRVEPQSRPAAQAPTAELDPEKLEQFDGVAEEQVLRKVGRDHWISPGGLVYRGRDSEGKTRVDHVLRHTRDQPRREGSHGVFLAQDQEVFLLLDEAWRQAERQGLKPRRDEHVDVLTVNMRRDIGFIGGRTGARKGHPRVQRIHLVLRPNSQEIITAYPRS